jgi:hypothetical protein
MRKRFGTFETATHSSTTVARRHDAANAKAEAKAME